MRNEASGELAGLMDHDEEWTAETDYSLASATETERQEKAHVSLQV
jgi:hypothetical protein